MSADSPTADRTVPGGQISPEDEAPADPPTPSVAAEASVAADGGTPEDVEFANEW